MIRAHSLGVPHRVEFTNGETTSAADVPKAKGGAGCGFGPHELLESVEAEVRLVS